MRARVPVGCEQYGDMLFTASATMIGGRIAINMLAARLGCDAVDAVPRARRTALFRARCAAALENAVARRLPDVAPQHGGPACFVSSDSADTVWIRIEDGRLYALKGDLPFNTERERIMGLRFADAGFRRLMEGC